MTSCVLSFSSSLLVSLCCGGSVSTAAVGTGLDLCLTCGVSTVSGVSLSSIDCDCSFSTATGFVLCLACGTPTLSVLRGLLAMT